MLTRLISSICGAIILGLILYTGGIWFFLASFAICVAATYEAIKFIPYNNPKIIIFLSAPLFMLASLVSPSLINFTYISAFIIISLLVVSSIYVVGTSTTNSFGTMLYSIGMPVYTGLLFSHGLLLYQATSITKFSGSIILLITIIITFTSDTGAYVCGKLFGNIKIMPLISPNKTLEGSIGGFVLGVIMSLVLGSILPINITILNMLVIGMIICIAAQLGDLFESKLKRIINIKESGRFMPGHGGLLDRIDSLLFTLPVSYYMFWIIS